MTSTDVTEGDKYRSYMYGEGEKDTVWRYGGPPDYTLVNKLFEEGRTQAWEVGSVEEKVQRLLKSWEMEIGNKLRSQDCKTINIEKFTHSVNGSRGIPIEELRKIGSYNQFLQTSLPENLRAYDPSKYTLETAQTAFLTTFPRGFAIEILEVYSAVAPKIAYKFRHWSFMEGPFQGHAPTGELVEIFGIGIFTVDESMRVEKVEFFYDGGELIAQLLKGPLIDGFDACKDGSDSGTSCPFLNLGKP